MLRSRQSPLARRPDPGFFRRFRPCATAVPGFFAALGAFAALAAMPGAASPATPADAPPPPLPSAGDIPAIEAVVFVPDFGQFVVQFHRDEVPNHVAHFLTLAAEGFYDGLLFHRIIPGYLVQTGDPTTREAIPETGSAPGAPLPYRLPAEPTSRTHTRGTVAMAWADDQPGTAASQWFVVLEDLPDLDRHATPIGRVVQGLDVVDRISQVTTMRSRVPRRAVRIESIVLTAETPPGLSADGVIEPAEEAVEVGSPGP